MDKWVATISMVSLLTRGAASLVQVTYGVQQPNWPFAPTMWNDYEFYAAQLEHMSQGLLPYLNLRVGNPPLFLYTLLPLYNLGGAHMAGLPIVLADALTAPIIYLVARLKLAPSLSAIAGLAYALMPLAIVNEGYLWLSSQPMTLFIVFSIYLHETKREYSSMASLAVAVMFKQEALTAAIPLFLWQFSRSKTKAVKAVLLFGAIILAISLPFLVVAPHNYVNFMSYQTVSIGTPEQGGGKAYTSANSTSVVSLACGQTTIAGLFTGAACGTFVDVGQLFWGLLIARINMAGFFLTPILLVLFALTMYGIRSSPNVFEIACGYSILGLLILFSDLAQPPISYYLIPVYAMILCTPVDRSTLAISVLCATASILVPDGALLLFFSLSVLFAITVATDIRMERLSQSCPGGMAIQKLP